MASVCGVAFAQCTLNVRMHVRVVLSTTAPVKHLYGEGKDAPRRNRADAQRRSDG
jgi:hypothetical protein